MWYRAIPTQHLSTALQTSHTAATPSRFNEGAGLFEVLYLTEDHVTALFEVRAMLGSPQGISMASPLQSWTLINSAVQLQQVADLTRVAQQQLIDTNAQELTGDWKGYGQRSRLTSVNQPFGVPAPTQELGEALFSTPGIEAFRTVSAVVPTKRVLGIFPAKLLPGSSAVFRDNNGQVVHQIP